MSTHWDVIILGCGQLGRNLKTQLEIENFNVLGVRRTPQPGDCHMVACDLDDGDTWSWLATQALAPHAVVVGIVTPDTRTESAYRARYVACAEQMASWAMQPGRTHAMVWVSSTAVFGSQQVGLLDESVEPEPDHWRGSTLLEAERAIQNANTRHSIIRFSGLYTETGLDRLNDPQTRARLNPQSISNRMHRTDAVAWLYALTTEHMAGQTVPRLIHGADQWPLQYADLFNWLDGHEMVSQPASTGRRIDSRHRDCMPELNYPSVAACRLR